MSVRIGDSRTAALERGLDFGVGGSLGALASGLGALLRIFGVALTLLRRSSA